AILLAQARSLATSAAWSCTKGKPTQAAMAYIEAAKTIEAIHLADNPPARLKPGWPSPSSAELAAQCGLLRCIFGNPFRLISLTPTYRTPTVVSLAHAAYDERLLPGGELEP